VIGLPVRRRWSAESSVPFRTSPAAFPAGVSFPPVAGNGIAGAGEPFLIATKLFQRFRGKELRAVAGGMAEGFEQTRSNQPWNLVRFKAEKPGRLGRIEAGGNELPTEKFCLLGSHINTAVMVDGQVSFRRRRGLPKMGMIWPAFKFLRVRRGRISATSTWSA
jgi:hypothetical protein